MLRVSRSVEYGLIAVDYLNAHEGSLVKARELSENLRLPSSIIAKILQRLGASGIMTSEQGAHGGYRLARDLSAVSVLDLATAIEGDFQVAPCVDDGSCERRSDCTVAGPVASLDARITRLLASISLDTLLRERRVASHAGAAT